jgi:hypothetical protein
MVADEWGRALLELQRDLTGYGWLQGDVVFGC